MSNLIAKRTAGTFRECVDARYRHDLIMNGVSAFLVLISPLIVTAIIYILSGTDTAYGEMEDYFAKAFMAMFAIQSFVMVVLMYRVYDRLAKHSARDEQWMSHLMRVCESKGADVSEMRICYEDTVEHERFVMRPYSMAMLIMMAVFTGWIIIAAVSRVEDVIGADEFYTFTLMGADLLTVNVVHAVLIGDLVMIMLMALLVFVPSFLFPHDHELRQCAFTEAMASALQRIGIAIEPMRSCVPPTDAKKLTITTAVTLGYGYLFMMFRSFRYMNEHLMNQWDYESKLLFALETDGRCGFSSSAPPEPPEEPEDRPFHARVLNWISNNLMPKVGKEDRMPPVMVIAELFLLFLLGNYYLKLVTLGCMMSDEIHMYNYTIDSLTSLPIHGWHNLILVFMDLYFIMLMIDSILGIASRKASSWRKVVRCCFTVVIPLWYSAFITKVTGISHLYDFNVYITTAVLYDILLLMLVSDRIKRYYTPIGYEMPRLRSWIRYAFWGDIFAYVVDSGADFPEEYFDRGIGKDSDTSDAAEGADTLPPDDEEGPDDNFRHS